MGTLKISRLLFLVTNPFARHLLELMCTMGRLHFQNVKDEFAINSKIYSIKIDNGQHSQFLLCFLMSLLLAFLGETKNGVSVSQQQSSSDDLTCPDHRHDICHKQCLCKIVSTPGKFLIGKILFV